MEVILSLCLIIPFLCVFLTMPLWIRKMKQIGLEWEDMNKKSKEKVAGSGGLIVVMGFVLSTLLYIAIKTFYFNSKENVVEILSLLSVILIVSGIGLIDDLFGWRRGGLSIKSRLILVGLASIPLMVINAGEPGVYIPGIGSMNIGIIYPLVIIPIGLIGATTTFNFVAGYNGLEASQGILILTSLSVVSWITGSSWLALIGLCMVCALIAFLYFNKFPAKVFPGDVLTYPIGAMIAIMAILGNYEMFAVFIFTPYIIETGLKLRGKLKKQSFGMPQKDGSIKPRYEKIYGLEHLAIKTLENFKINKKVYEWEVVLFINLIQLVIIILGFLIFII